MKQNDAVVQAVINVTGYNGDGKCEISKEQRAQVALILHEGFMAGNIEYSKDVESNAVRKYIPGLINNHLRKDKRLNGNVKYTAKNPGSRAGSGDAQLKNMKLLLSTLTVESERAEVQACIDERIAVLATEKQTATVDFSALPADLAAKFSK